MGRSKQTPRCARALVAGLLGAAALLGQTPASLKTAQTSLRFHASPTEPQLVSIAFRDEPVCSNDRPEPLIASVEFGGRTLPVHWEFNRRASRIGVKAISLAYSSTAPRLLLRWEWKVPLATGPIEHTVRITNLEPREIWIPMQDSFRLACRTDAESAMDHFYVEKGAGEPSAEGTHLVSASSGYRWTGNSSTYAHPTDHEPREIIPFFAVRNGTGSKSGWYLGIEFSGRTRLTLERDPTSLRSVAGLNPDPGPFRTRLKPHETFEAPTVFLGAFQGSLDALSNVLRPWVRGALTNARAWSRTQYPMVVNNSWGSGMQVDETLARRMIRDSAELGGEMFHIDAGWFRGVGDWRPDPKKFPHGLAPIAADAHRHGLRFGIWADWAQAALDTQPGALNLRNPQVRDWTVSDLPAGWKPEAFKGQTIDIGVPAAQAYAQKEVLRIIQDYHLDMLEHDGYVVAQGCVRADHPHAPPDPSHLTLSKDQGSYFVASTNSTDVSYHAVRAYYKIHEAVRALHPGVLLEVCNDGGRMVDFGSAAHGDYFSITDTYTPLANRRAFYDASYLLPPAMLEAYVANWPGSERLDQFRYMLRSGMMGWLTLMLDTTTWSAEQHAVAKQEIQLYKERLRPFIRGADLYHISARPDGIGWDGIEYFDPLRQKGVVYAFRGSTETEGNHAFRIQGLTPGTRYRLHFQDGSTPDRVESARDLSTEGLEVNLARPNASELIFFDNVEKL